MIKEFGPGIPKLFDHNKELFMKAKALVGVTGGIAAYKTPELVRALVKGGFEAQVVMTRAAHEFVTPLSLATVSERPVCHDMWSDPNSPSIEHISLADNADLAVIAPATANIIGKLAAGIADDLLTTVFMAVTCPVLLCPSMNVNMLNNPALQDNLARLKSRGFEIMTPDSGFLACGWSGPGRMPPPEAIAERMISMMGQGDLKDLRCLITAGPTEEPIDPVRFLTNRSSGKMGVALAARAKARGAEVVLISGPIKLTPPGEIEWIQIRTAQQMRKAVLDNLENSDIIIKAAAVADFRPVDVSDSKIKKDGGELTIRLVQNRDILKEVGESKRADQILVGFAAETDNPLENARKKLVAKNLDMLVLNDVSKPGAGFDYDTNIVRLLFKDGRDEQFEIMSKTEVADKILDRVLMLRDEARS